MCIITLIWIPKLFERSRGRKGRPQMFHPTFKIGSNTRRANMLLVENILKEG